MLPEGFSDCSQHKGSQGSGATGSWSEKCHEYRGFYSLEDRYSEGPGRQFLTMRQHADWRSAFSSCGPSADLLLVTFCLPCPFPFRLLVHSPLSASFLSVPRDWGRSGRSWRTVHKWRCLHHQHRQHSRGGGGVFRKPLETKDKDPVRLTLSPLLVNSHSGKFGKLRPISVPLAADELRP